MAVLYRHLLSRLIRLVAAISHGTPSLRLEIHFMDCAALMASYHILLRGAVSLCMDQFVKASLCFHHLGKPVVVLTVREKPSPRRDFLNQPMNFFAHDLDDGSQVPCCIRGSACVQADFKVSASMKKGICQDSDLACDSGRKVACVNFFFPPRPPLPHNFNDQKLGMYQERRLSLRRQIQHTLYMLLAD